MTPKLPVKTFEITSRKKIGLIIFTLVNLLLAVTFLKLGYELSKGPGRIICLLIFLFVLYITFFGVVAFIRLAKENFIGFFISSDGLNDISTGHNYGVIMWKDVTKVRIMTDIENDKRKYIVLKVQNPQEYISRETLEAKRRSMMLKLHYYGSPICFSDRGLNCSFEELEETVKTYYNNYQQRKKEKEANNNYSIYPDIN